MIKETRIDYNNYLVKQLPKATVFLNKKLEVVHVSDKWIQDFELTHDGVIGKKISELFNQMSIGWQRDIK